MHYLELHWRFHLSTQFLLIIYICKFPNFSPFFSKICQIPQQGWTQFRSQFKVVFHMTRKLAVVKCVFQDISHKWRMLPKIQMLAKHELFGLLIQNYFLLPWHMANYFKPRKARKTGYPSLLQSYFSFEIFIICYRIYDT